MQATQLNLIQESQTLTHIADDALIRRFQIQNKGKKRDVNDPIPELKQILKDWNPVITQEYMRLLKENQVNDVAHAYLPNKSIQTNARAHLHSPVIQFDFKGFYDSCRFDYFKDALKNLDPTITEQNEYLVKRLLIDANTNGVTQGLPVSGALAGITLVPFWVELKKQLPPNIRFTQYSDDLTFSFSGTKTPEQFTIPALTKKIQEALTATGLDFTLNTDKTRAQKAQFRKVTGIRINHHNQMTPSRNDYRFLRHALYILSKSGNLNDELNAWGFQSKEAFVGKISYLRSIDQSGKIDRIIMQYSDTCRKHNVFTTWIDSYYKQSAFA